MNYRHAYHAGNHADVLKHAVLARTVEHLKKKQKPFRVIDAHAGAGAYALDGIEAGKTLEWQGGIGKMAQAFAPDIEALLKPYREAVAALNPAGELLRYPGSPEVAARLMRAQDRLIANELHPDDNIALERHFLRDPRVAVAMLDAEACVKSNLPPPERRGLILIDPSYEERDEAERAPRMLAEGIRRFATGIFMLWYPVKGDGPAGRIVAAATELALPGTLKVEMRIREVFKDGGLAGSGLVMVNPPWQLNEELRLLVPALASRLALGDWGQATVDWLLPPK
ncbi:MAG: 23S rRNA (adenine(2030)-N(6))-methyltransferase RlmJ [Hyphomicrobiales bacterium]